MYSGMQCDVYILVNILIRLLFTCSHVIYCLILPLSCISSVQSLSCVWLFATSWITARQASLSITNSRSSLKLMSIKLVMPSSHLILCRPLLLLPPIPSSIRVFSNESTLRTRWSKYWHFSFNISPSNEHPGLISFRMAGWHHRLDGHEFEWTPGVGDGQGGLACCDSWGHKESDTTELLNWTDTREGED